MSMLCFESFFSKLLLVQFHIWETLCVMFVVEMQFNFDFTNLLNVSLCCLSFDNAFCII